MMYGNEKQSGRAILHSGLDRNDLFFTTKITPSYMGYEPSKRAINLSLSQSELDYIDLSVRYTLPYKSSIMNIYIRSIAYYKQITEVDFD